MTIKVTAIILKPDNWLAKALWKLLKVRVVAERWEENINLKGKEANLIIFDEAIETFETIEKLKGKIVICSTPKSNDSFEKLLKERKK